MLAGKSSREINFQHKQKKRVGKRREGDGLQERSIVSNIFNVISLLYLIASAEMPRSESKESTLSLIS